MMNLKTRQLDKINASLKKDFVLALNNKKVKAIVTNLELNEQIAMKYTSKLEQSACELENCENCHSLLECKNKLEGYVYYPQKNNDKLIFSYVACKFKKQAMQYELESQKDIGSEARMKDIDISDKKRVKVIKWLKNFYDKYDKKNNYKGLYLHGNFGCGKTYLISALLNELENKRVRVKIVYFPEMLRELKDDWDTFGAKMDYYKNVDILLIDDIGAEKVTSWGRDEILGTILQNRMEKHLTTFFTSNLNIEELERHLSLSDQSVDLVKARRIIERIKQLTEDMELISENKRKKDS